MKLKKKKTNILILTVIAIVIAIPVYIYGFYNGHLLSRDAKSNNVAKLLEKKEYDQATELISRYYDNGNIASDDDLKDYKTLIENVQLCRNTNTTNIEDANSIKRTQEKQRASNNTNNLKPPVIEKFDINSKDNRNAWLSYDVTVYNPNPNKAISYIEIYFDEKDSNGNVVDSTWTNDTNIAPNSRRVISKSVQNNNKQLTISPKITKYNYSN